MCYSVMVETDLKKLGLEFDAVFDLPHFISLLEMRANGISNIKIPRAFEANFSQPKNADEKKAAALIQDWQAQELQGLKEKLELQKGKILDFSAKLSQKETKTARDKLATAERVSERLTGLIDHLEGSVRPTDALIHQYTYAPLLVKEGTKTVVRLYRYQLRPRWAQREPDRKINMFNARLDSLEERKSWDPLFMNRHGLIVLKGFYEWVPDPASGKAAVINFFAKERKPLWVPALHDHWEAASGGEFIDSFAILTKEPPREVEQMGHDRCPIHPAWEFATDWLNPKSCTKEYIYEQLSKPSSVQFEYAWGVTNEGWDVTVNGVSTGKNTKS